MGKAFSWGIGLLATALICGILAATGVGGQGSAQLGAYCITAFFVIAALPFFITALVKHTASRREIAAVIPEQQQEQPLRQGRSRLGVFLPQALPEQQGRNKPRQEER